MIEETMRSSRISEETRSVLGDGDRRGGEAAGAGLARDGRDAPILGVFDISRRDARFESAKSFDMVGVALLILRGSAAPSDEGRNEG
jgi:hypothetical protein